MTKRGLTMPATIFFLAIFAGIYAFSVANYSRADEVSPRWKNLVDAYVEAAFSNGKTALRKIEYERNLPVSIECKFIAQANCIEAKAKFKLSFEINKNLQFEETDNPTIRFVFTDDNHILTLPIPAQQLLYKEWKDTSDWQCKVFYQYLNSRIFDAQVYISTDQSNDKIRACLIFQTSQSLGLSVASIEQFQVAWGADRNGGVSRLSPTELEELKHSTTVYEFIHMCKEISAGMHLYEVKSILLSKNSCISELAGIN